MKSNITAFPTRGNIYDTNDTEEAGWLAGVSAFSNINIYKENEQPASQTPIFTRKTKLLFFYINIYKVF